MVYLCFVIMNIAILIYLVTLALYPILFFKKKYPHADKTLVTFFLEGMITIMVLSWLLIIMNGGFNINFYINIEFGWILFIIVPILILVLLIDYYLRKRIKFYVNLFGKVARFLLPTISVDLFAMNISIYYFSIYYFIYLLA